MIFFTSDTHYFHTKILAYCNRPFATIKDMNKKLIENHNSIINKDDEVYILGDFCFGDFKQVRSILRNLNGKMHLIVGNHCKLSWDKYIEAGFCSVQKYKTINVDNIGPVGLAHDPTACITLQNIPWLVGHMHQQFLRMYNAINVGVDVRNYYPVSLIDLEEDFKRILISIKHNKSELIKANMEINNENQNIICN